MDTIQRLSTQYCVQRNVFLAKKFYTHTRLLKHEGKIPFPRERGRAHALHHSDLRHVSCMLVFYIFLDWISLPFTLRFRFCLVLFCLAHSGKLSTICSFGCFSFLRWFLNSFTIYLYRSAHRIYHNFEDFAFLYLEFCVRMRMRAGGMQAGTGQKEYRIRKKWVKRFSVETDR